MTFFWAIISIVSITVLIVLLGMAVFDDEIRHTVKPKISKSKTSKLRDSRLLDQINYTRRTDDGWMFWLVGGLAVFTGVAGILAKELEKKEMAKKNESQQLAEASTVSTAILPQGDVHTNQTIIQLGDEVLV